MEAQSHWESRFRELQSKPSAHWHRRQRLSMVVGLTVSVVVLVFSMVADMAFGKDVFAGFVTGAVVLPLLVGVQLYEHYGLLRGAAEACERDAVQK